MCIRDSYREFDARCATALDEFKSTREYEMELYIPDVETKHKAEKQFEELLVEASNLPAPDPCLLYTSSRMPLKGSTGSGQARLDTRSTWISKA